MALSPAAFRSLTCIATALICAPLIARADNEDEQLLRELTAVVDEGTAIATSTHMNVDYVPGMVTVLEGHTLASLGARTVLDAMALVPGVLTSVGADGSPFLLVRGVQFPFNGGNVKVLVNSIAMSRESAGVTSSVLHMPIEQVERIEFVRGPGSMLYGDFAYMGLLNIVTRTDGSGAFARVQDDGNVTAGGRAAYASVDKATRVSLNAGGTLLHDPETPETASGVRENGKDARHFAALSLGHDGFSADLQSEARHFHEDNNTIIEDSANVLQLKQALTLSPALSASIFASGLMTDSSNFGSAFKGNLYEGGAQMEWRGWTHHDWVAKASYTLEDIDRTRFQPPPPPPPAPLPPSVNRSDLKRRYYGVALQDQWSVLDNVALTAGARYDRRDDLPDERVTPRVAAVWRVTDAHILKAQYSEGYRAPTFFELYPSASGQSNLDLEAIATSELSYIYRAPRLTGRLTAFHSHLSDMVFISGPGPTFGNVAHGWSNGAEAELEQQLTASLKWLANVSCANSATNRNLPARTDRPDAPPARWLSNAALLYTPVSRVVLGAHVNYVGARNATAPAVGPEYRVALSAEMHDLFTHGLSARVAVRNAAAETVHTVTEAPTGTTVTTFDDAVASLGFAYDF